MQKVIIFGTGAISEIAYSFLNEDKKYTVACFTVDSYFLDTEYFYNLPVIPFESVELHFPPDKYKMFIPLSYTKVNLIRKQKFFEAKKKGYDFITYIHPSSTIYNGVNIGKNCFIFEDNTIQPFVRIGNNCIIWSGNHIGHHSIIEDHCFISSHVVIAGGVIIGERTFIGINATIRDHIKIGKANVIGARSLIMNDTNDNEVYIEKPTKPSKILSYQLKNI